MPLVPDPVDPPELPPPPGQINLQIAPEDYKHNLVDNKIIPYTALLTHIGGSSLTVDYYSQVVGADQELSPYEPWSLPIYQQYVVMRGYELKVQGDISQTQDPETLEFVVTGTAILYPFVKPNQGDVFVADIGEGRAGLYVITSSVAKSFFKQTCYEINFTLVQYMTELLETQINERVVKETFYRKEFLTYGQNPVLVEEDVVRKDKCEGYIKTLFNSWAMSFYSSEYSTFVMPGQFSSTYDPFLVDAIFRIFERNEHPILYKAKQISCGGLHRMKAFNLWWMLTSLDGSVQNLIAQKAYIIDRNNFINDPLYNTIRFSGIDKLVYPNMVMSDVDKDYGNYCEIDGDDFKPLNDYAPELASDFIYNVLTGIDMDEDIDIDDYGQVEPTEVPWIHPVLFDDFYVFSGFFYTKTAGQSKLEVEANRAIANQALDYSVIFELCERSKTWGRLERFYYVPVLIILLKVALRRL